MHKAALITGGSRGIGRATAIKLAELGYDVCVVFQRDADAAAVLVDQLVTLGVKALSLRADVMEPDAIAAAFVQAIDAIGPLTAVVNNAGIVGDKSRFDDIEVKRLKQILGVNVLGVMYSCQQAIRHMSTKHGGVGGSIVNVSSVASRIGSPGEYVDYAASKGAVDALTLGLAKEVATEGVRVNVVRPGIIDTDIHASGGQPDRAQRLSPQIPMGRPGEAEEVAATIAWLVSDQASYCTGAIVDVSGGR